MELLSRHYKDNAKIAHAVSGAVTNMSRNPTVLSKFVTLGCIALLSLVMNYYANKGDTVVDKHTIKKFAIGTKFYF